MDDNFGVPFVSPVSATKDRMHSAKRLLVPPACEIVKIAVLDYFFVLSFSSGISGVSVSLTKSEPNPSVTASSDLIWYSLHRLRRTDPNDEHDGRTIDRPDQDAKAWGKQLTLPLSLWAADGFRLETVYCAVCRRFWSFSKINEPL